QDVYGAVSEPCGMDDVPGADIDDAIVGVDDGKKFMMHERGVRLGEFDRILTPSRQYAKASRLARGKSVPHLAMRADLRG
ncbi:MAG: hypothetical protein ACU841_16055, partial [Gammaproteobacteria bacterium]